jgi:nucleolar protein 6
MEFPPDSDATTCPDPPPMVRQLTKRVQNSSAKEKSRGCAFLEFPKASGLQNALRLHHTVLDGRIINVELSAGGGGNNATRVKRLKTKNAKLDVSPFGSSLFQYGTDADYSGTG